jgi:hypothetical protein
MIVEFFLWIHALHTRPIHIMTQEDHMCPPLIPEETINLTHRGILMIIVGGMIQGMYLHHQRQWIPDPTTEECRGEGPLLNTEGLILVLEIPAMARETAREIFVMFRLILVIFVIQ